uniref:RING-type E3 ubiquitin transferase (cysteine targeting) n=1 Tax=Nephromyces sp. MMRI TaxID=2496275 RepID=A0A3S8V3F5_9APIC|nr:peroxisomal biogenesis factor 2 [Nephromyces sp. MMRI]
MPPFKLKQHEDPPSTSTTPSTSTSTTPSTPSSFSSKPPLLVNGLDGSSMNDDLIEKLTNETKSLLPSSLHPHLQSEIKLVLSLVIISYYLYTNKPFPGDVLQNVKYETPSSSFPSSYTKFTQNIPSRIKYLFLMYILPYLWMKHGNYIKEIGMRRRISTISILPILSKNLNFNKIKYIFYFQTITGISKLLSFFNLLMYLIYNKYRTVSDRVLQLEMSHISPSAPRHISFDYMNSRLQWSTFIDFVSGVLPLVDMMQLKAMVKRYLMPQIWWIGGGVINTVGGAVQHKKLQKVMPYLQYIGDTIRRANHVMCGHINIM